MIVLNDSEQVRKKAIMIFGKENIDLAFEIYNKTNPDDPRDFETSKLYIGYCEFERNLALVVNDGGIYGGMILHIGDKQAKPYLMILTDRYELKKGGLAQIAKDIIESSSSYKQKNN